MVLLVKSTSSFIYFTCVIFDIRHIQEQQEALPNIVQLLNMRGVKYFYDFARAFEKER